ncbi:MAG: MFS transporter [Clostridia bacterium]|nr:MFS transporter [Clostridia bacterium]
MNRKSLEKNIKIYPFYRAFSYDFLFLWTISIMYLTWKGLSYSETIFLDAIFMISAFVLQIPITRFIKKIGRANGIRLAGLCCVAFCVIFIACDSFLMFTIANILYGISAAIKNVADTEILALSLKKLGRSNEFSKIEGKGSFWHYIFESVSAILSGYMFEYISPYAPVVATLICSILLVLFAILMKDPRDSELLDEIKLETGISLEHQVDTIDPEKPKKRRKKEASYKMLMKDKFIISMMVFCFCFYGIMSVYSTLAKVYYQDIGVKASMFGFIYFGLKMVTAICSKFQFKYELKFGVRSLIIFSILTVFSFGMNGIMATISATNVISVIIISLMFVIQNAIRAPYRIFVKNYINISSEKENLSKVLTLYSMAEYLGFSFITLTVAVVMELTSNSFALTNLIITGIIMIPMMISIIIFIKELIKKYSKKLTIIRSDMKDDI